MSIGQIIAVKLGLHLLLVFNGDVTLFFYQHLVPGKHFKTFLHRHTQLINRAFRR